MADGHILIAKICAFKMFHRLSYINRISAYFNFYFCKVLYFCIIFYCSTGSKEGLLSYGC